MKEKMITTSIYIEEKLMKDIKNLAQSENRTPNNYIITILKKEIEAQKLILDRTNKNNSLQHEKK